MMQARTQTTRRSLATGPSSKPAPPTDGSKPPLSVVYADALYRPVPPVEYDDDGYPGPDGKVSESTRHTAASTYAFDALRFWFRDRPETLVAYDLLMLFEEGNREAALSPDLMVILDAGNPDRSSYKFWEEGNKVPAFALEVLSKRTWRKDVRVKPGLYAALAVREYWLFEPFGHRLTGYRLSDGEYKQIRGLTEGGYRSEVLGLDLLVESGALRFRDPASGEVLLDHVQSELQRVDAQARAESAQVRASLAERRIEELEAALRGSR